MVKTNSTPVLFSRLTAQHVASGVLNTPSEIVCYMGAMQAQEFAMAKWAIGMRSKNLNEQDVDNAFNTGKILRTHLLRPTWHFVAPQDIRWLLKLTAPRVHQANAYMYRQCELTPALFKRSNAIITKALEGGNHLIREELQAELAKKKIVTESFRLGYLMMHAELEGLICSGPRRGNQFTYALIDEWVPQPKNISNTEALRKLTLRFFSSRGPATAEDFRYWSALTAKEIKKGIELAGSDLHKEEFKGKEFYFSEKVKSLPTGAHTTFLMPDYDEYGMSYKDKTELIHPTFNGTYNYNRMFVVDGLVSGSWKRTINGKKVSIEIQKNVKLTTKQNTAVIKAAKRFASFINKEPGITIG